MHLARPARALALASAALAGWLPAPALAASPGTNVLVSRPSAFGPLATPTTNDSTITQGEGSARVVSDDDGHRFIAFMSDADGLSDADDDRFSNVFVRDRTLGVTILVSRADGPAGAGADANSSEPSISSNGRFVAFESSATNIAPGTTGDAEHVYVRDLVDGTTELVDRADGPDGALANNSSFSPALTVVGGSPVVAFVSAATNLDGATSFNQVYVRAGDDTEMISRPDNSTVIAGNGFSSNPSISTDGTRVGFQSDATNLGDAVAGDDVLVRTLATNDTAVVAPGGNGDSRDPSLSGDGGEIAFTSTSSQLLPAVDPNTRRDVYKATLPASPFVVISRAGGGGAVGNKESSQPSISDDGAVVAFASPSDNLTPSDTNAVPDVFVGSGTATTLASRPANGVESNGGSATPSIARTAGGSGARLVAFTSAADNMGADDEDDFLQVYGRFVGGLVLPPNLAIYVSRPTGAEPFRSGVNASFLRSPLRTTENAAAMSQDGRFTVFLSTEDDLAPDDDDRFVNVYRRDNLTGETLLVSRADGAAGAAANDTSGSSGGGLLLSAAAPTGAPSISADGNRVVFASAASNLVADDSNSRPDVFVRDVAAGSTLLASRDAAGAVITVPSGEPAISGDGRRVAFVTSAPIDLPMDGNANLDVYLRDLDAGSTQLVSRKGANGPAGDDASTSPAIDADGSHVAFATDATDFSAISDLNNANDVWVRDVAAGKVSLVSEALGGGATGDKGSFAPAISADGNRVAFASLAANLVGAVDVNGAGEDVFVRDVAATTTTLVSRTDGPGGISGNSFSERPSIDASGTRIAFESFASDLVLGDVNGTTDVLLRDTVANTTELVSRAQGVGGAQAAESSGTPSISGNGDCVAFQTFADDFVAMPPGTDYLRVVARAVRGDCPFGPLSQPPAPPAAPPGGAADTTAPAFSAVSIAPRRFLAGTRVRPRTPRRPAIGARIRFTLSEAAAVTIRVDALLPGRRRGRRCVPPARAPRGRACTRVVKRGTLTRAGAAGANRVAFTGRLGGKRLPPGPYRATLKGTDLAGNVSAPSRVRFTVLRPL